MMFLFELYFLGYITEMNHFSIMESVFVCDFFIFLFLWIALLLSCVVLGYGQIGTL